MKQKTQDSGVDNKQEKQSKKAAKEQGKTQKAVSPISAKEHIEQPATQDADQLHHEKCAWFFSYPVMIIGAIALRFGFFAINEIFTITTDIDYHVYTEGARELVNGGNPYDRFTYRYTPLIAYMMIPNLTVPFFGKILFNVLDLWAIAYMDLFLRRIPGLTSVQRYKSLSFWALNPFMAYINGRGSCESVSLLLLAAMLYHLRLANYRKAEKFNIMLSGVLYGLLIHFRIYPVIFGLTLYIYINKQRVFPRLNILIFGILTIAVNVVLVSFFYKLYGDLFLQECYLYHLKRKDPRHNYSLFWIQTVFEYFTQTPLFPIPNIGRLLLFVRLGLICVVSIAWRKQHLYAMLIQTFIFTTLNTVYTAQYIIWEIQLLPYLLADSDVYSRSKKGPFWLLILLWFINLEYWAVESNKFEHLGRNTFYMMHFANLGYFLVRVLFLHYFIENRIGKLAY